LRCEFAPPDVLKHRGDLARVDQNSDVHWVTRALVMSVAHMVPPLAQEESFTWHVRPADGILDPAWTVYTDGSMLDGPTLLLRRTGWAFVALDAAGNVCAAAFGTPPPWIHSIFGAEVWAVLQVVAVAFAGVVLRIDCKSVVDALNAGMQKMLRPACPTARAWAAIFMALDEAPPSDAAWMPAHTAAAEVGRRAIGNGEMLTERDRRGNDLADQLAKRGALEHRVPAAIRKLVAEQEATVTLMAWWVARVTVAANAWGPLALRDTDSAPVARWHRPAGARRARRRAEAIPCEFGGHDIRREEDVLKRQWHCRVCHRSAATRTSLARSRCQGSAAVRWARVAALAAADGNPLGGGHCLLMTGPVVWCWKCGANACVRPRHLLQPCVGKVRGFLTQARRRLLLGLHPGTRVPLADATVAEPGHELPPGFVAAAAVARRAAISAAEPSLRLGWGSGRPGRVATTYPSATYGGQRFQQLRERVRLKEASVSPKRRRISVKRPPGGTAYG